MSNATSSTKLFSPHEFLLEALITMAEIMAGSSLQSDLILDVGAFAASATTEGTHVVNRNIVAGCKKDEKWWEVSSCSCPKHLAG